MNITVANARDSEKETAKLLKKASLSQWILQWMSNYIALVNATMALK